MNCAKGPYVVHTDKCIFGTHSEIHDANGDIIAHIVGNSVTEQEATARLLAKSWEMAKLLQEIEANYDCFCGEDDCPICQDHKKVQAILKEI